jgi:TolB protein
MIAAPRALGVLAALCFSCLVLNGCSSQKEPEPSAARRDRAVRIPIETSGSLQNPAWSPDGDSLVITAWRGGYNEGPADLLQVSLDDHAVRTLVSDGNDNVNLPGAAWNAATEVIVFSSAREPHDEIFIIDDAGTTGDERRLTDREDFMAYEPSLSPDGQRVVFESHVADEEDNGIITSYRVDGSSDYEPLTPASQDCRQPNWSPAGDKILYQRLTGEQWEIWTVNPDGSGATQVTSGKGDKTDASFSPDGAYIVYSSDERGLDLANLFVIPTAGGKSVRVTNWDGYDGAPSWSPDGSRIAFESYDGDPDGSPGTELFVVDAPALE